jgi:putative redox protein
MAQTIQVMVNQISETASQGQVRGHQVMMDRPEEKGGENKGPMGGELLLMSLGGCYMSNLLAAISARKAGISDVRIHVNGTLDGSPARFTAIRMEIAAKYSDRSLMQKLVIIAERSCIVANTIKHAVDITLAIE